ncbi:MAG: CDP-glycerol glycerophosphotransferase family protein [Bifidobacteriaceae bacterium]|jgi:CDP-glycerol glycerophosphotransferase (TagB/SpsB family)|nr:CDP-glycerol glycerophosphotransferase family protein [Bifidobacteriaceae bacterium]
MLSREQVGEPEDFRLLREALWRRDPRLDVMVDARFQTPGLRGWLRFSAGTLAQLRLAATARVVVVDTYSPVVSGVSWGQRLRTVQLWHALGALKWFGWDAVGMPDGRSRAIAEAGRMHRGYDMVLVSSERCRDPYASAFRVVRERIAIAPLPRVDLLLDPRARESVRRRILAAYPDLEGRTIVLYAPTHRPGRSTPPDVAALARAAASRGLTLIHSRHPLAPAVRGVRSADGFTTAELASVASAFATDYSSAVFEAALLGVPCYFFAPDLEAYRRDRGLYTDIARETPFPVVSDPGELMDAIVGGASTEEDARAFAREWITVPGEGVRPGDRPCADQVAGLVLDQLARTR